MSVIWKDGRYVDGLRPQVFHDDIGLFNGLGVFDSMLADSNILVDAKEHFERLVHDVDAVLGIGPSWLPAFSVMTQTWLPLLEKNNLMRGFARIKTVVTGGVSIFPMQVSEIPTIIVSVTKAADPKNFPPVSCAVISSHPRVAGDALENCKRLDYTRSYAARREAQKMGAEEAILTNTDGHIACAATSNLFIVENGQWVTPPLIDGVLDGITRRHLIDSKNARQESVTRERLQGAQEIYLCNSFTGLRRVSKII